MLQKEMVLMHVQLNEVTMECYVLYEQLVEIQKRFKCYNKSLPLDNKLTL